MRKNLLVILICTVMLVFGGKAGATVLTFDDLPSLPGGSSDQIPSSYGGLNWSGDWYYVNTNGYTSSGYVNGTVSGDYVAFNTWHRDVYTTGGSTFDWNGAYFTAAWNDGLNIDIEGYSGATLLYSTTLQVDTSGPTWLNANWTGIDKLTFHSYGGTDHGYIGYGTHFAMDNFTFNESPAPVPEPSTWLLLGSGLIGLTLWRRKSGIKVLKS